MTDEFEPWLGRIGDRGRGGERLFKRKLRQAAARLGRLPGKTRFTGAGLWRGGASARALEMRGQRLPGYRMRRVIVKTHIRERRKAAAPAPSEPISATSSATAWNAAVQAANSMAGRAPCRMRTGSPRAAKRTGINSASSCRRKTLAAWVT